MATVSDDFNRADSTNLGSNWNEDSGEWLITSNTLRQFTAGSSYRKARWVGAPLDTDNVYAQVVGQSPNSTSGFGAFVRGAVSTTVTYYAAAVFGGDSDYLVEVINNSETILDTGSARSASTTYTVRIEADGNNLRTLIDSVESCTATDTTLTSGAVGCMTYGELNGVNAYIDNFWAGDLGTGAAGHGMLIAGRRNMLVLT